MQINFENRYLSCEDVLEELANMGYAPNLLYDDNGHFALVFDGFQTVPDNHQPADIETSFFVPKEHWKDSIYEAVLSGLKLL